MSIWAKFVVITGLIAGLGGCSKATHDPETTNGKRAIIDATQILLSTGKCHEAVAEIEKLYNSEHTDNEVRLIAASAYACVANVNFFKLIGDIVENADLLGTGAFWALLAKLFPSPADDPNDKAVEGAILASEALMSVLKPGAVVLPETYVNGGTFNPGSALASDRTDNANLYLFFVSLAAIGAMENRFGAPDQDYVGSLPWQSADHLDMGTTGCAFASSILNFWDTLGAMSQASERLSVLGALKDAIDQGMNALVPIGDATGMDLACATGCLACGVACDRCPTSLRDRTSCAGTPTDINSCAAAGIVNFVNATWLPPL